MNPNEEDEIKFPIDFSECPMCGSPKKIADSLMQAEVAKGRAPENMKTAIVAYQTAIGDPAKALFAIPVVTILVDVCADCGILYCVHAELGNVPVAKQPFSNIGGNFLHG